MRRNSYRSFFLNHIPVIKYKRILLKLSGESLMGEQGFGIDSSMLHHYAQQIQALTELGVEVAIVIGGCPISMNCVA